MNANANCFYKALFWEKHVFCCSIIDVGRSVYSVNYPWYEHAKSSEKRWRLAVATNGWHDWAIRNLSQCLSVVSGCLEPCFIFLRGEHLCVQTGNHGIILYIILCPYNTRKQSSVACIQRLTTLKLQLMQTSNMYQMKDQRLLFMIINKTQNR